MPAFGQRRIQRGPARPVLRTIGRLGFRRTRLQRIKKTQQPRPRAGPPRGSHCLAQRDADGSVDEGRRDTITRGLHNITYQLWHWEPERFVDELEACLADITEQQKHIHFWIDEEAIHVRIVEKDIHKALPQAASRDVIALAVIMAMLVPEERQTL